MVRRGPRCTENNGPGLKCTAHGGTRTCQPGTSVHVLPQQGRIHHRDTCTAQCAAVWKASSCLWRGGCGVVLDVMCVGARPQQSKHACGIGKLKRLSTVGIEVTGDSSWRAVARQTQHSAPGTYLGWLSVAVSCGRCGRPPHHAPTIGRSHSGCKSLKRVTWQW